MTNAVYPKSAEAALTALFPDTATIQALSSTYVYSTAHQHVTDLSGLLGNEIALTTVAFTNGILTADDPTITGLSNGDVIKSLVVYNDTGVDATSRIVGFIDTDSTGAPINFTSDGSNELIAFPGLTIVSL